MTSCVLLGSPPPPAWADRAHLRNTAKDKPFSVKERACSEILEQINGFHCHSTPCARLKEIIQPLMEIKLFVLLLLPYVNPSNCPPVSNATPDYSCFFSPKTEKYFLSLYHILFKRILFVLPYFTQRLNAYVAGILLRIKNDFVLTKIAQSTRRKHAFSDQISR